MIQLILVKKIGVISVRPGSGISDVDGSGYVGLAVGLGGVHGRCVGDAVDINE